MGQTNQNPSRLGRGIPLKNGNPYRNSRGLFMGQETAEEKARRLLEQQWDRDHPTDTE